MEIQARETKRRRQRVDLAQGRANESAASSRFDKRGPALPGPLDRQSRQDARFVDNQKKTKRPSFPAVALDEEHRRDSMLQDLCLWRDGRA
jgi:hypothetical protein